MHSTAVVLPAAEDQNIQSRVPVAGMTARNPGWRRFRGALAAWTGGASCYARRWPWGRASQAAEGRFQPGQWAFCKELFGETFGWLLAVIWGDHQHPERQDATWRLRERIKAIPFVPQENFPRKKGLRFVHKPLKDGRGEVI